MIHVQLKLVDEGLYADLDALRVSLRYHLSQDSIFLDNSSALTLKIKFTQDHGQEKVLIVLRETGSKEKLGEKVIPFVSDRWLRDVPHEAHALVANLVVHAA